MTTTDAPLDAEELDDLDADPAGELNHRWGVPHAVGRHLETQLERYRNIITTLEAELAETTQFQLALAELTRLNAEGRPWQITRAEAGA